MQPGSPVAHASIERLSCEIYLRGRREFAGTCQSSRLAASYITEFSFSLTARDVEEGKRENGSNDGSCEKCIVS